MTLRCGKHITHEAEKYQLGPIKMQKKLDALAGKTETMKDLGLNEESSSENELEELKTSKEIKDQSCKLILKLKTSQEGYWILNDCCDAATDLNTLYHEPPLVNCYSYHKKLKERQRYTAQLHG